MTEHHHTSAGTAEALNELLALYDAFWAHKVRDHAAAYYCMIKGKDKVWEAARAAAESCGAESNRHSGAVGAEKRAEQSNPGGGHEVTEGNAHTTSAKPLPDEPTPAVGRDGLAQSPAGHLNDLDKIAFELEEWIRQPDWAETFSRDDMAKWAGDDRPVHLVQKLRALAAQPPAAPVETPYLGKPFVITPEAAEKIHALPGDLLPSERLKRAVEIAREHPAPRSSAGTDAAVEELAEFLCDEYEGKIGSFCSFNIETKDRWRDLVRAMLARIPAQPQTVPSPPDHLERVLAARDEQLTEEQRISSKYVALALKRSGALRAFLTAYGSQDSHSSALDKAAELARDALREPEGSELSRPHHQEGGK
jgi:hypothetical protein